MARGDVVSDIQDIAAGANLDFQPGAGEEYMITEIIAEEWFGAAGPYYVPNLDVLMIDGTNNLAIVRPDTNAGVIWGKPMKLFLTNTHYLRLTNRSASTRQIGYTGIQTK